MNETSQQCPLEPIVRLQPGVRYVVTRDSNNREFQCGDHIWLADDGSIICREAMGWMPEEDVADATEGMEVAIDATWMEKERKRLERELSRLQSNAEVSGA